MALLFRLVLWLVLCGVAVFVGAFLGAVVFTKSKWWYGDDDGGE